MATAFKQIETRSERATGKVVELPAELVKMTDKWAEKVIARAGHRATFRDAIVPGLYLRVSDKGVKNWAVLYRLAGAGADGKRGPSKRMALGAYPLVGLEKARQKARDALEAADRGTDPAQQRAAELDARQTRTFEVVFERFVELHVKQNTKEGRFAKDRVLALAAAQEGKCRPKGPKGKLGRVAAERIIADNALPVWRGRLIETITRAEVHDLLDRLVNEKGEALARELRKHMTKMFNWCADRGHIAASPLAGMRRPELGYVARERDLSMEELRRVWDAADKLDYPFGQMYRLLILTGQRRSEIAELERSWVDAEHRVVEIPASRYKTKRPHVYTRAVGALVLVAAVRRVRRPGVKFDEMLVLESPQGTNKSSALRALAVRDDWFVDDLPLNAEGKVVIERLAGRWIAEAGELKGMRKGEVEHLKAFLSRQEDTARMSYARLPVIVPRQCVIIGTTNSERYLRDLTGNRRFWPVRVEGFDLDRLRADTNQLWAEAAHREAAGDSIRLDPSLWASAGEEQDARRVEDPFASALSLAVGDQTGKISSAAVWDVLHIPVGQRTQDHPDAAVPVNGVLERIERLDALLDGRRQPETLQDQLDLDRAQREREAPPFDPAFWLSRTAELMGAGFDPQQAALLVREVRDRVDLPPGTFPQIEEELA